MLRAAVYCRISRDRVGAGLGVQRQEEDCRELAERLGWTITKVLTDNDLSAYSGKPRPGYRALLELIDQGAIDVVVAWHTDRLHRSPVELEDYIAVSERRGVSTHTVKAGPLDLSTPSGRLVARQLGAVARYEVEHAIERQQRAKTQARAEGKWLGGRRPFGYEPDGVTVRSDEAQVVRMCTDAVLAGESLRSLAAMLNAQGSTTSTGGAWGPNEVRRVLLRPRNIALITHKGEELGKANWQPLLAESQWRAVVAFLNNPDRRTTPSPERRWLLSGIATCGVCGAGVLCTRSASNRQGSVPAYTCKLGRHVVRSAGELDGLVTATILERLSRPDATELLSTSAAAVDVAAKLSAAESVREKLDGLALSYASGAIDARQLNTGSGQLRAELEVLEADIAAAGQGTVFAGLAVGTAEVEQRWDELGLGRKRTIVQALLGVVILPSVRGRRKGWKAGESYFDPASISITPKM